VYCRYLAFIVAIAIASNAWASAPAEAGIQMQEASAIGSDGKPIVIDGDPGYSFRFMIGDTGYLISDHGSVVQEKSSSKPKFRLSLPSDMWISGPVFFASYGGDFLILYEISDAEDGSGEMARIDGKTFAVKWTADVVAFNVAPGLISQDIAYVASSGFIGAINLTSGHYDWCVKDLYQGNNIFVAFDAPKIRAGSVIAVQDEMSRNADGEPYYVWIDWKIGKVVTNASLTKSIAFLPGCRSIQ
jgi:hypothetical protein